MAAAMTMAVTMLVQGLVAGLAATAAMTAFELVPSGRGEASGACSSGTKIRCLQRDICVFGGGMASGKTEEEEKR
jgi:hypothetical protein